MPRVAAAAKAILALAPASKLEPPTDLPADAKAIWNATVSALPSTYFNGEHVEMLRMYCMHSLYARALEAEIAVALIAEDRKLMAALMRAHALQSQRVASLGTKLRITPQSNKPAQQAQNQRANYTTGPKPWDWRAPDRDPAA